MAWNLTVQKISFNKTAGIFVDGSDPDPIVEVRNSGPNASPAVESKLYAYPPATGRCCCIAQYFGTGSVTGIAAGGSASMHISEAPGFTSSSMYQAAYAHCYNIGGNSDRDPSYISEACGSNPSKTISIFIVGA